MTTIAIAALILALLLAVSLAAIISLLDERDAAHAENKALRRQLNQHRNHQ